MPISIGQRMAGAEKVGAHKTSMLQDLEAGRPLELEAVVGAVIELGDRLGVPMPATRAMYACARMLNEKRQSAKQKKELGSPTVETKHSGAAKDASEHNEASHANGASRRSGSRESV
jgi:hypothetical protein